MSGVGPSQETAAARSSPSIVHVAESFASGTAAAIADFVRNYPAADHHLVYAFRDAAKIDPRELSNFASATALPAGTLSRVRFLRRHLRGYDGRLIVHAHSSLAGAYVRTAVRKSRRRPLFYTPHCYAFERRDVSSPVRGAFRLIEWLLSFNTTAIGACSPREARLSRWVPSSARVVTVPNVQPTNLPSRHETFPSRPLRIVGNGRLGPQKDPEFFAAAFRAAAAACPGITAVWVGGGDAHSVEVLEQSGVEVTGWLPRPAALDVMSSCDLYLHTALWEGFPVSIMEAVGLGLPVVCRKRPYLTGVDLPVVIDKAEEFAGALKELEQGDGLIALRARTAAALEGNTDAHQRKALEELYGPTASRW